jgi:hypothetical protein
MIYVYALHVGPYFVKYSELICCYFQDGNFMTCLGTDCNQKIQIKLKRLLLKSCGKYWNNFCSQSSNWVEQIVIKKLWYIL